MKYLKAFIAGLAFPATIFPIIYFIISSVEGLAVLRTLPIYFVPLAWGVWNVIYFAVGKKCPIVKQNLRLYAHGAILGFIAALLVVFAFKIPLLLGATGSFIYAPLVVAPAIYSILWRYFVKYLNSLIGLEDW